MSAGDDPPVVYAIGGPNGAGRTTFAREFLPAVGIEPFLNADSLAAGLSPLRPEAMPVPAARLLLALVAARTSFAFESTFSGRTYAGDAARGAGGGIRGRSMFACGCRVTAPLCAAFATASARAGTTFRRKTSAAATCRARAIFSSLIPRYSMLVFCTGLSTHRRGSWRDGQVHLSKSCSRRFMEKFVGMPPSDLPLMP